MADLSSALPQLSMNPRMALANQLMQSGTEGTPVQSWTQELARALSGVTGAYMLKKGAQDYGDTLSKAMQAEKGWVSPDTFQGNNGQTIKAGTVAPGTGGTDAMLGVLQGNPATRNLASQLQMEQLQEKQKLAAALAQKEGEWRLQGQYEPGIKGGIAGAEAGAKQPYEQQNTQFTKNLDLRNTTASNRQTADLSLRNDWQKPQHLGPGDQIIGLGGGAGGSPNVLAQSPNPPPGSQPGEIDQYYAKLFVQGQNGAIEGRNQLNSSKAIQTLLDGVQTGKFAGTTLQLKKAAKSAGIDLDALGVKDDVAPQEAATALANAYALQLRNPAGGAGMPGAMSDADRQFLQSMTPGIETTPEGRQQMLNVQSKLQERNEQVANMQRKYLRSHSGRLDSGWLDELQNFSEANPLFKDIASAAPAAQPPAPAAIPEGATATNPQTNQKIIFKGGQWVPQ